jgi:glucose-1-phosphate cytidylyltransferase
MIAVILAGGLGTRMGEETIFRPKPMVEIGTEPALWHLIKFLEFAAVDEFIIAGGYKIEVIEDYIERSVDKFLPSTKIRVVDTGPSTPTGGRLFKLRKYLDSEKDFLCTYGDGLADVDVKKLVDFHRSKNRIATVTGVKPRSRFGVMSSIAEDGMVHKFEEKPLEEHYVNGGYFIFTPGIFTYLSDTATLEAEPMMNLVNSKNLSCFQHDGFWKSMDTYRENRELHEIWQNGCAPWLKW